MSVHTVPLGYVCEVVMGQSPPSSTYNVTGNGLPFFQGKADFGEIFPKTRVFCNQPARVAEAGDILISVRAPVGPTNLTRERCCIGRGLSALRPLTQLHTTFLFYFLRYYEPQLAKRGLGSTFAAINRDDLEETVIPLPDLSEQSRIAGLLEQADRLRRTRRYALELGDTFLPAVFLEFFGHSGSLGWQKVELQEVVDMLTGYPFLSEEYVLAGDTVKLCRGANVLPDYIDWSDLALWPKSKSGHLSEFILQAGDVLIAMDRPWISEGFKVAQIRSEDCPALLVQRVARLRGKNGVPNEFLYHLLRQPAFTRHCRPTETTVPHISPKDIQTFTFQLPPLALQQNFAALVARHERLRASQREALRQADHLFQSLLHRNFSPMSKV